MIRRWSAAALIAVAGLGASAGVASAACSHTHVCRQYPAVAAKAHTSEPGYAASAAFTPPGDLVSLPGLVVPIPQPPGPTPIGDFGAEANVGQTSPGGDIEVGGVVRTPAGNVSLPGLVVPIPQPPGPSPIGDGRVEQIVAAAEDAIGVHPGPVAGDSPLGAVDVAVADVSAIVFGPSTHG